MYLDCLLLAVAGTDCEVEVPMKHSSDTTPTRTIRHERNTEIPACSVTVSLYVRTMRYIGVVNSSTYIWSISKDGLSEYIAERLSIRSRATSAEDTSIIGLPTTLKKVISPSSKDLALASMRDRP
jgi:hypothetical protein